jgi:hypothetical protein
MLSGVLDLEIEIPRLRRPLVPFDLDAETCFVGREHVKIIALTAVANTNMGAPEHEIEGDAQFVVMTFAELTGKLFGRIMAHEMILSWRMPRTAIILRASI